MAAWGPPSGTTPAMSVCRVIPDVRAVDREFDYLVPEGMADHVRVGTIVRVPLHGRRVRGWVTAIDVEPETPPERRRPIAAVVSLGPPPAVVDLAGWAAWRWSGPRPVFLKMASPPTIVRGLPAASAPGPAPVVVVDAEAEALAKEAVTGSNGDAGWAVVRWPPTRDAFDIVWPLVASTGSTLVIAPNAHHAAHLARRLARTGRRVVHLRPDDSQSARTRVWVTAAAGRCVVVGGRTAVWLPVPDLAAVVVLDDADEALQDERAPTWHARDVAGERARRKSVTCTVVSPVPTVDAVTGARAIIEPSRAVERAGWPIVEVVDRRLEAPGLGLFSERLVAALRSAIEGGGRAVCVLNRKGRARLLACDVCGELGRCERCGAAVAEPSVSIPGEPAILLCPRCDERRPRVCAACGSARLKVRRAGVGRVRDDLAALLVRVEVAEVEIATGPIPDVPVLVGTEAVLHRIERAAVVAFLDFDQELLAPRFRAAEQAMWLLVRAARVVGSRVDGGRVLVQTRVPHHEVLDAAVRANPAPVTDLESTRRRDLALPPFGGVAIVSGDDVAVASVRDALQAQLAVAVGGDGHQLFVRAPGRADLSDALATVVPTVRATGARLRVEVDPPRL